MRPASITHFDRVVLLMILLGFVSAALNWDAMLAYVRRQGLGETSLIVVQAISVVVTLLLLWLIVHRRSGIARWIWIALVALGIALMIPNLSATLALPKPVLALQLIQTLLSLASVWLLFRPDARGWFDRNAAEAPRA